MKEIKILHQNLRNYPDNLFVYPKVREDIAGDMYGDELTATFQPGLVVVTSKGEEVGFIELGDKSKVIL